MATGREEAGSHPAWLQERVRDKPFWDVGLHEGRWVKVCCGRLSKRQKGPRKGVKVSPWYASVAYILVASKCEQCGNKINRKVPVQRYARRQRTP